MTPTVSRITIYPVKSCDGFSCAEAAVLSSGGLKFDRRFALVDPAGKFINAKRTPLIQRLRFVVDPDRREFSVSRRDDDSLLQGHLDRDGEVLSDWLSTYFSLEVSIVENDETGFPDDLDANGPTIVSLATLEAVCEWFPGLTIDDVRSRFRANVEVDGVEPFWEDRLFRADKTPVPFKIGDVTYGGVNPCQRCVVPTRDPISGEVTPSRFAQLFQSHRQRTLPSWAARERFDHFYRLTTNTVCLDRGNCAVRVGDPVGLADPS